MNDFSFRNNAVSPFTGALAVASPAFVAAEDALLDRLPIAIYLCDRGGRVIRYNRRAAELWGGDSDTRIDDPHSRFRGPRKLFLSDGTPLPQDWTPVRELLGLSEPVRDRTDRRAG